MSSTDLPIIPCYESKNCKTQFNCSDKQCDYQTEIGYDLESDICATSPRQSREKSENTLYFYGSCNGSNENACNGVYERCPDVPPNELNCNEGTNNLSGNFALSGKGERLGCDVLTDNNCIEFERDVDVNAYCDDGCWNNGGFDLVKSQCESKIGRDINMCKAMEYFCDWDEKNNICSLDQDRELTPPYKSHPQYLKDKSTFFLRKDCSDMSNDDCIEFKNLSEANNERYYVDSAQSSWDSKNKTSYHKHSRINCVHDTVSNKKVCINLPRCQWVENPSECGSVELLDSMLFMCSRNNFLNIDRDNQSLGSGFCTWCKGTQTTKTFSIPQPRGQDVIDLGKGFIPITRDPIDWENSVSRCSNYNECENNNSEELWNKCIYDNSNGYYGYNYESSEFKNGTKEQRVLLLRNNGFCAERDPNNQEEWSTKQKPLIDKCTNELEYLGSINWGRVFGPNTETEACQYRYNWEHNCVIGQNGKQISENYLCTWCPSLQCKIGSQEQICSEVAKIGEWDELSFCNTDSNHGKVINNKAPDQCDCFLPKLRGEPTNKLGEIDELDIAIMSTGLTLISIIVITGLIII